MGSFWMIVRLASKFSFFCNAWIFDARSKADTSHLRRSALLQDKDVQKRVWSELAEKLEKIQPGILQNL